MELRDGDAVVAVGAMKLTVPRKSLRAGGASAREDAAGVWTGDLPDVHVPTEIDLRGMRPDEAEARNARRRSTRRFAPTFGALRIIHGKGTGALRERVAEMLRKDTRVRGIPHRRLERRRRRRDDGGVRVIPDDVVERVREEADIVSIIGEYVKLKTRRQQLSRPVSVSPREERRTSRCMPVGRLHVLRLRRKGRRLHLRAEASRARFRRGGEIGRSQSGRRGA